jgi:DivIVA domain-containing protein
MALSPQRIRDTSFKAVRRGYDPGEVDTFVEEVAAALETAQNEATAMEARARAAVARLQELSQHPAEGVESGGEPAEMRHTVDEAETISRTLLLAQRTADTTIAEAQAEADRVIAAARDEAASSLDAARQETDRLVEEARNDARRAGESERVQVEGEVQALLARRDFLESDVDQLEQYLLAQRERIIETVASLNDLVQRVPGGLAEMRRPLLSAAAEPPAVDADGTADGPRVDDDDDPFAIEDAAAEERSEITEITKVAEAGTTNDASPSSASDPLFDEDPEPTQQLRIVNPANAERPRR